MRSIALASSSEEPPTVFEELIDYIADKYFTPDFSAFEYQNIHIDTDPFVSPAMIFLGVFIAVFLGAGIMIFNRRVLGRLVRRLIKKDALSPDRAKTLEELELTDSKAIRLFINRPTLSKTVRCVEEDEYYGVEYVPVVHADYSGTEEAKKIEQAAEDKRRDVYAISLNTPRKLKYKRNPLKDHFYIPERKKYRASVRFDIKGTNPITLVIIGVLLIAFGILFMKALPYILNVIDGIISTFKGQ